MLEFVFVYFGYYYLLIMSYLLITCFHIEDHHTRGLVVLSST